MSAHDVWSDLVAGGWPTISQWRVDGRAETLFLDFKQAAVVAGQRDDADDRKNLGKEMSGFGNWEGGVIVFGAETTKHDGADVLHRLTGVGGNLRRYEEQMRVRARGATQPPLAGVDVRAFEDPGRPGDGVVAVYVPFSDGGPYRADGHPEINGRYYVRTTTDTIVMSHQMLAAMFGRRPLPSLRMGIERTEHRYLNIHVDNRGHGAAMTPFVRIKAANIGHSANNRPRGEWKDRRYDVNGDPAGWTVAFALPPGELIYPGESRIAGRVDLPGDDLTVTFRLDCQNAPPVARTVRVVPRDGFIVWCDDA